MTPPSEKDKCVKVTAYITDELFGYPHWRAGQFCIKTADGPKPGGDGTKPAALVLFDSEMQRDIFVQAMQANERAKARG